MDGAYHLFSTMVSRREFLAISQFPLSLLSLSCLPSDRIPALLTSGSHSAEQMTTCDLNNRMLQSKGDFRANWGKRWQVSAAESQRTVAQSYIIPVVMCSWPTLKALATEVVK